ncbi:hypothetical protein HPB51_019799 [Rhipicephalus microplus]|uniref:PDZ domain-containing protein n=1 Tax=Rhipicephalus microplus TaxID=6941 RepID=A0A9J6EBE8_RHIMP|nr:hypothetical protein HPB51_019799 [Rhipicephalus microplus]
MQHVAYYAGLPPGRADGRRSRRSRFASVESLRPVCAGVYVASVYIGALHDALAAVFASSTCAKFGITGTTSPLMEQRLPTENWPSLQYLDDVDVGGVADLAGLKRGDFLLEINGQDVSQATHECVVNIILQQGDLIAMTVLTVAGPVPPGLAFSQGGSSSSAPSSAPGSEAGSVPAAGSSVTPPMLQANGAIAGAYRQCATLPRKLSAKKAPAPPKRDPKTTLSVGRARAKSMVAGLTDIGS